MRSKALIIGARPSPFVGPEVRIADGRKWAVEPEDDYRGRVAVRVTREAGSDPVDHPINGERLVIEGAMAQGVILPGIDEVGVDYVSVNITEIK